MGEEPRENESTTSSEFKGSWWEKIMSIRLMVVLLCLWSVACAGGAASAVIITSYESALDKTQSTSEKSTNACFGNAKTSLRAVTNDLLALNSASVVDSVTQITNAARSALNIISKSYLYTDPSADKSTWDYLHKQRKPLLFAMDSMKLFGITGGGISLHDPARGNKMQRSIRIAESGPTTFSLINDGLSGENSSIARGGPTIPNDGDISVTVAQIDLSAIYGSFEIVNDGMTVAGGPPIFRHIIIQRGYTGIVMIRQIEDPISKYQISMAITLSLDSMSGVLNRLAESSMEETGALIYLYTVVASSPFYKSIKEKGLENRYPNERFMEDGTLTSVSNGSSAILDEDTREYKLLQDTEATDITISAIAEGIRSINGDYGTIHNSTNETIVLANEVGFVVDVGSFKVSEGLDWWLISAINVEFVVGDTERAHDATVQQDSKIRSDVDSDLEEDRKLMIIILVAVTVVLVLLSTVSVHVMLRPLETLKTEMTSVSDMQLEESHLRPTIFFELGVMQQSFEKMVRNLKEYKAYVPTAVLEGSNIISVPPPSGTIAIVFTDIVSSTSLWARAPSAMNDALEMHNECIRTLMHKYNGYEVKTIGDSFMVSFGELQDAVIFCLKTQEELVKQKWPTELDLPPQYSKQTDALPQWSGLRLRMGCQFGEAGIEENPLTGRIDYRGSTVNMAARLEAKALPGTLCVSKEIYRQITKGKLSEIGNPVVQDFGSHELRGIGNRELVVICPTGLSSRLNSKAAYEIAMHEFQLDETTSAGGSVTSATLSTASTVRLSVRSKRTGLTLALGQLTIAVCRLNDFQNTRVFDNFNLMLKAAIEAASQTDGVLGNVTGKTLTVVWNGSKQCKLHTTSALRFASQLQCRISSISRIGIGTGSLLYGNVGTNTQRFATAFGRPLEAAEAAADMAQSLGTFAVIADCNDGKLASNPAIVPFLRLADVWMDSEFHRCISIFEILCCSLIKQLEDGWGVVTDGSTTGTDAHNKIFRDVLSGKVDEISKMEMAAAMSGTDPVLPVCKYDTPPYFV